mmetsp:Transcript_63811/g.106493  ORF Transcript_63811/g.106493 Transcript_63811/m.106493 type:complete len:96 (+) Transcript_63811:117-404(+)
MDAKEKKTATAEPPYTRRQYNTVFWWRFQSESGVSNGPFEVWSVWGTNEDIRIGNALNRSSRAMGSVCYGTHGTQLRFRDATPGQTCHQRPPGHT